MSFQCLPPSFGEIRLTLQEQTSSEDFQEGGHLVYRNEMYLAALTFHDAMMLPTKFRLKLSYGLAGHVV